MLHFVQICVFAPHLLDEQQQDCQEFLRFLLDGMSDDLFRRASAPAQDLNKRNVMIDAIVRRGSKSSVDSNSIDPPRVTAGAISSSAATLMSTSLPLSKLSSLALDSDNGRMITASRPKSSVAKLRRAVESSAAAASSSEPSERDEEHTDPGNDVPPLFVDPPGSAGGGGSLVDLDALSPREDSPYHSPVSDGQSPRGMDGSLIAHHGSVIVGNASQDAAHWLALATNSDSAAVPAVPNEPGAEGEKAQHNESGDAKAEEIPPDAAAPPAQPQDTSEISHEEEDPLLVQKYRKIAQEAATKAWNSYLNHNDSIITDLFAGQLQSTIECLHCHHRYAVILSAPPGDIMRSWYSYSALQVLLF